jgi:copper oxidase (laccase) domain-containing protein
VIEDLGICTICDSDYFSHRREGAAAGRQGGFAWLR